jgi:hypothetical protein
MTHGDLLGGPGPTFLLPDPAVDLLQTDGQSDEPTDEQAVAAATAHPESSLAWAVLAEHRLAAGDTLTGYAFARVGYHRGLDALRRNGWKGYGPIPGDHEPNQGFLRCLRALAAAAEQIGEDHEAQRCREFLADAGA